jgi:hypothetical protein
MKATGSNKAVSAPKNDHYFKERGDVGQGGSVGMRIFMSIVGLLCSPGLSTGGCTRTQL